ncbi:PilZ domain-containing protein, partial [Neobacillus drentensis]|uniref:PilZ domain-containing protein n=1 Tax=Neobacillus drentensis TaxID=220684 RepID=UPI002FFEE5E1
LLKFKPSKKEMTTSFPSTSYRIKIKYPFDSEMTLVNPKELHLEEGNTVVFIENMGPGGLRFTSTLQLMIDQEIIFSFEAEILEEKIHLPGAIIWSEELSEDLYQYGVQFHVPETARTFINNLLNDYFETYFHHTN